MLIEGGGSEEQLRTAWQHIGDNFARQCNWKQVSCVILSIAYGYGVSSAQRIYETRLNTLNIQEAQIVLLTHKL